MWQSVALVLCASVGHQQNWPPLNDGDRPRVSRTQAIEALEAKIAQLESDLAMHQVDLTYATAAPTTGEARSGVVEINGVRSIRNSTYLNDMQKQKEIGRHAKAIQQLSAEIQRLKSIQKSSTFSNRSIVL